ncbi:MAG: histidine kinase [Burkholderiales bacterium]
MLTADPLQARPAPAGITVPQPCEIASTPDAERDLRSAIEPMLAAIVGLAGATGGAVSVTAPGHDPVEPLVSVGETPAGGLLSAWCATCSESLRVDSACVRGDLCRRDDRVVGARYGPVCERLLAVPLRHRDRAVGTLTLWFAEAFTIAPGLAPLLPAVGDLVGTALDNERLARENLNVRLASERQMLANEVHDSLAQGITYMRMRMTLLRDAMGQGDELRAHKYACDIDETLQGSQQRLRELITHFRTPMEPGGLVHALDGMVARFLDRTGVDIAFVNRAPDLALPANREIEVFRVVQEALTNVARHASATHAALCVDRVGGNIVVAVEDDGVGLGAGDHVSPAGHYGIEIMNERARRLGGTITIAPNAMHGTRLQLTFPCDTQGKEATHE